nr:unnamed protein product [Callosobruchus analis]
MTTVSLEGTDLD